MRRRGALIALALAAAAPQSAGAHAGLTAADPAPGANLGASPAAVRLTFSERPEPSLSSVVVTGPGGATFQRGSPRTASGQSLALAAALRPLGRGVYTVTFRTVSAVDGHATTGSYAFGVGESPKGGATVTSASKPRSSRLEVLARWLLLTGLVALLGAAVAGAAGFGSDRRLAVAGWAVAAAGLILLAVAQRSTADSSLGDLLKTPVGHALLWRAVCLALAGGALLVAARRPAQRRAALVAAAAAALATVTFHVANGHAAAGAWSHVLSVTTQVAHVAAVGVWIGGLATLLLSVRGAPTADKAAAVRRFSLAAGIALAVVVITGTIRAIDELNALDDLLDTGYGRAILAKIALIGLLAGLGWRQRTRSVPAAAEDLEPLRRAARPELALATAALAAAALLGTLAPPVTGKPASAPAGLQASGSDFATTLRVRLTTASKEPGPNRFVARVEDYDSKQPVTRARVRLRFTPLDDPGVDATSLALRPNANGDYEGTGANLTFDGRWRVTALVQRGPQATEIPLELDVPGPEQLVSTLRAPGAPHKYTMQVSNLGYIQISPQPDRAGPSRVYLTFFDVFEDFLPVTRVVVTATAGDGPTRQVPVRPLGAKRFVAGVRLRPGPFDIAVIARNLGGGRMRGVFELKVPR